MPTGMGVEGHSGQRQGSQRCWLSWPEGRSTERCSSHGSRRPCLTSETLELCKYLQACWLKQERIHLQCRKTRFDPWVGKIPWRRKWRPTPVFLPGQSHGQRSLAGYSPWVANSRTWLRQLSTHTRRVKSEETYVYLWFILADVWQKFNTTL